jgi:hypothetical protein
MVMATHMVKVAREGYVAKAVRAARPGETSGGSLIYEVVNVPDNVTIEQLVKAFEGVITHPHFQRIEKWRGS